MRKRGGEGSGWIKGEGMAVEGRGGQRQSRGRGTIGERRNGIKQRFVGN